MSDYLPSPLTPDEVSRMPGALVLDFGAQWCGHCARARTIVDTALQAHPTVRHIRVEDGPGRRLGRHFRVKLWPTLVFLRDGIEVTRRVRPQDAAELAEAFDTFESTP